ncbi:MAG TPA: LacI family DNA-binding transcriptional regulator [Actinomycetes bacterium]
MSSHEAGDRASVTLATLARELGVSKSTVSNAYNRPDQLSPALRARILDAARRLGYPGPDPLAATLSRGRVGAIGLVFFDDPPTYPLTFAFTDPVHALFLQGVADACGRAGVGLVLLGGGKGGDLVRAALVDGFICQYDVAGDERFQAVAERGLPVVVVDGPPDPAPGGASSGAVRRVGVDDRGAARAAARHLLELGHRAIGVVAAPLSPDGHDGPAGPRRQRDARYHVIRERLAGYRAEVEAAGLPWAAVPVEERSPYGQEAGRRAAGALLDRPDRPSALLAMSDELALGALRAAEERGLDVPGQLSVVGFDDTPAAAGARPPLTTVHQPHRDKGRIAAELLLRPGTGAATRRTLPADLVVRGSTAPPPAPRR